MKNTGVCPKCGAKQVVRVPDNAMRYSSGNNIYTSTLTLAGKIPVIRYVCRLRMTTAEQSSSLTILYTTSMAASEDLVPARPEVRIL